MQTCKHILGQCWKVFCLFCPQFIPSLSCQLFPLCLISSTTRQNHLVLGSPIGPFPLHFTSNAILGILVVSILFTWPNTASILWLTLLKSESVFRLNQLTHYFIMQCYTIICWVLIFFCPGRSDSHWSSRNSSGSHVVTFISLYINQIGRAHVW
jgi:hypothetical protein